MSNREIAKLRSILQPAGVVIPSPNNQLHPAISILLTALLSAGGATLGNYLVADKQGYEARRTSKIDRRVAAIREASELIYQKGPDLMIKIQPIWHQVSSLLKLMDENPLWPCHPEHCTIEDVDAAKRQVDSSLGQVQNLLAETDRLLSNEITQESIMHSLFASGELPRFTPKLPLELQHSLQDTATRVARWMPTLAPLRSLTGRPLTARNPTGRIVLSQEAIDQWREILTHVHELFKSELSLSKGALEDRDQAIRQQLTSLLNRVRYAVEHLDQ